MIHETLSAVTPIVAAAAKTTGVPAIDGLVRLGNDLAGWLVVLQFPIGGILAIRYGFKFMRAEDPHEKKQVYDRFISLAVGLAIVGTAPWLIAKLISYFG